MGCVLLSRDLITYLLTYLLTYMLTYLLDPWSRVLLENLTGSQLVKKFSAFYGTRMFITVFKKAHRLFQSLAKSRSSLWVLTP